MDHWLMCLFSWSLRIQRENLLYLLLLFLGKLGPVWRQLQSVVSPDLRRSVCWACGEGGLCLHKLHTARIQQSRIKTKKSCWRMSRFTADAAALKCTPELCVSCGFSPLPSGLPSVNMVLLLFPPELLKTSVTVLFLFCFFLTWLGFQPVN